MKPENQKEEKAKPVEELTEQESVPTSEELHSQLRSQQEKNLRLLAEMENVRKRMQKDKHDTTRFAVENVIGEFLVPLDNFENACSFTHQASEEVRNWAKGFEMILGQFKEILSNHHVTPFSSEGTQFDPHLHDVIEIEETEQYDEETVIQEFVQGYKCGDRVLRPARVKVAKKPKKEVKHTQTKAKKQTEGEE